MIDLGQKVLTIRPYDPGLSPGDEVLLGYIPARVIRVVKKRVSELTEKHAMLAGCKSLKQLIGILRYSFWKNGKKFAEDAEVYLIYLHPLFTDIRRYFCSEPDRQ